MSNRLGMPAVPQQQQQQTPQQGVKKSPGSMPSNALIRQLLTNGSRNEAATLAAAQAAAAAGVERSDPESDIEQSDDDDDDKSVGRGSKGGSGACSAPVVGGTRIQLPRSALRSLVRGVLGNVRTSPDAINCLNSSGARFVLAVSRKASRICEESGRSLITGEDLLRAITAIGCSTLSQQLRQQFSSSASAEQAEAEASITGGLGRSKGRRPSEPVLGNVVGSRKRRRGTTGDGMSAEELEAQQLALLMEARQADDLAAQQLDAVHVGMTTTDEGPMVIKTTVQSPSQPQFVNSQNTSVVLTLPPQTTSAVASGGVVAIAKTTTSHFTEDYDT